MPLTVKDSSDFIGVPAGTHLARCYRIVDKGTQKGFQDKYQPTVMLQFEIHGEDENGKPLVTTDGRPLSISKSYNCTLAEKSNLRKDLQMWRGKEFTSAELRGFELKNVLGHWAMLTITRKEANGKTYSRIDAISSVPRSVKEMGLPQGVNALQVFDIENPDMEIFDTFSEKLKADIMAAPEWPGNERTTQKAPIFDTTGLDEEAPF
jgi:hypothetical protein